MALWGFIPAAHIEKSGSLPVTAQRLDTGQWVDLSGKDADRAHACGWWNLDTITAADVQALAAQNHLTQQQIAVLDGERTTALGDRDQRRLWVSSGKDRLLAAKTALLDKLDGLDNPPSGNASLALHTQQIAYLYNRAQYTDLVFAGDGTLTGPGVLDLLGVVMDVLLQVVEQTDGLEL